MFADKLAGYILLGVEAELDCVASAAATEALKQAQFVVSMSAFCNEQVKDTRMCYYPLRRSPKPPVLL